MIERIGNILFHASLSFIDLAKYRWYRKLTKGTWYYNRLWFDLGRGVIFYWSRNPGSPSGGNFYLIKKEEY